MLHRATANVRAKTPLFETVLQKPAVAINKEMASLFMKCILEAHRVMNTNEDMAGTVFEIASDTIDYVLQSCPSPFLIRHPT